jgi:tetratricopeptide (TPR) repeat protein/MinD-like ATPase involved in chromosome partitioning or flagellar assembly
MALANMAWILAANGRRVLMADWDLESPGLHRFFQPFIDEDAGEIPGIVDIILDYEWAAIDAEIDPEALISGSEESQRAALVAVTELIDEHIRPVKQHVRPLTWQFPGQGALHFLSSGKQSNGDYQSTLSALEWEKFYEKLHGNLFFDALRLFMKQNYDYVLIDSRTGLSDVADICTVHLPDVVVDCFTLSTQGIEGAAMIAEMIQGHNERQTITILPVPMRIERTEKKKAEKGLRYAADQFGELPVGMSEEERRRYWAEVEVPYRSAYAYEETLAAFGDPPSLPASLLSSYERIAARITGGAITNLPPMDEWLRLRTRLLFTRGQTSAPVRVVLDCSPEDQLWAEWIAAVLANAGIEVLWVGEVPAGADDSEVETRAVMIVSEFSAARMRDSAPVVLPDLLISVSETRLSAPLADVKAIFLASLSEAEAVALLVDMLNGQRSGDPESGSAALRYPGADNPQVANIPARNTNFTGRDKELQKLREDLRAQNTAGANPLTILGLSGVGKTQMALEYAHRFQAEYDVVWWMNCGQSQYIDASLADLGQPMRATFTTSLPEEGGVTEVAQQVLELLGEGRPDQRWLLIYDNAEDIEEITPLLPDGGGHILITSRNAGWKELGSSVELEVFAREDSIDHLRWRNSEITDAEANQVARVLGDMPLAVAAAGALIAEIGISVPEYLRQLELQPAMVLPEGHLLHDYPVAVAKAWNLSLDELQKKSPPAARLLEICSMMAQDISLGLINGQAMADTLKESYPSISERAMIDWLIRQIDLLALIKFDPNAEHIQVHTVVQAVVFERMAEEDRETARRAVHRAVAAARPDEDVDDPRTWPRYRLIWPHLTPSGAVSSADTSVRQLLIERVRYLRQRDDLARGRRRAEEIEQVWKAMLGGTLEPEMAESLQRQLFRLQFNLANILRDLARFKEARRVDEAVLAGQDKHLGKDHPHTLQTRGSLGGDLRALGDYQAALELDLSTYEAWNAGFGERYHGTLAAAHNLALSYLLTGDFGRALALDRPTLRRRAAVLRPDHPRTFDSGTAVVRDLLEAGRYGEAVTRAEAVWTQSRDALGRDARITLSARLLLGVAVRCGGGVVQAAPHIDAARAGLTRGFGSDSSDALAARLSRALNLMAMGDKEQALIDAEEVLEVYQRRLGSDHPHTLICRLNIATVMCLAGDLPAAETEARLAANGLTDRLGEAHPYTLAANMVLASVLANRGDLTAALALDKATAGKRADVLGKQHPDTLRSQLNLLLTQQEHHQVGAAEKRPQVIDELGGLIGRSHPDVTAARDGGRLLAAIDPQPF